MHLPKQKLFDRNAFAQELESQSNHVALFRRTLSEARKQLELFHDQGASSRDVVQNHAWLIDQILHFAWIRHQRLLDGKIPVTLLAVGGYGRGELHPYSDVDLMLLLGKGKYEKLRPFSEAFFSFLWDIGLEVGHSVRSVKDCVRESKQDLTVVTNIMESRLLEGDEKLLQEMRGATGPDRIWPPDKFFEGKKAEMMQRHRKFDDTAYNLEPNIKDGPGGLRDIQTVSWVMQRRYGITDLKQLVDIGFLTDEEHRALVRGRNFLWRLRVGLHFVAHRREDRMLFDHQRTLAREMGYEDDAGHLAVEHLMKRYYRTVKELRLLNEILLQHYEEENLGPRTAKVEPIDRRFRTYNGYLETTDKKIFERFPFAMLELFLVLNQRPELKGVRAVTIRQLRANLHRINQSFRDDIRARSLFMEIMRFPYGQTRALRRMNNYGVLGAYIPAFGSVVGQMQHDLFHVYTVDAHSLFVIRNLRRFKIPEYSNEFPLASELITRLFKPERLFLAGLFHDIAKGRGGDHSELGEQDAYAFCKRHDMSEYDARFVAWLVRHHLIMSYTAQRLDISDPAVINEFASRVGDPEHLNNLYLLTVADIRGTSPHVWNAWKGRLLEQLHSATTRALRLGQVTPDAVDARIEDIKHEALALVNTKFATPDVVREYWSNMPPDYFLRHNASELAWHIEHIAATSALQLPLVVVRPDPDIEASSILVYAPDVEPLLTVVTAALAKQHLNIAEARLHVTPGGFALYTFVALTSDADTLTRQDSASLQQRLRESMLAGESNIELPQPRMSRTLKHFPIKTRVTFSNGSRQYTAMEVVAQDQPGLLHRVAKCLWQCKVRLVTAKIATYGARAEDVFFITDRDGDPVSDAAQLHCLSESIQVALVSDTVTESQPKAASA